MKIVNLFAENIKKIKVVDITPKGDVVIIEGRNAQGKSSIMDTISMALGGEKLIPQDPVRHGEERAAIKLDLGEFTVRRTWKKAEGGSVLEIKTRDGEKVRSPQEFLNEKLKLATLDPSVFVRMRPVERVEELKKIPGLDCNQEDAAYLVEYDKRTLVNRDLDTAKKSLTEYEGIVAPKENRAVAEIQKEIDAIEEKNKGIRAHNKGIDEKRVRFDSLSEKHKATGKGIAAAEESIKDSQEAILKAEKAIQEANTAIKSAQGRISAREEEIKALKASGAELLKEGEGVKKALETEMPLQELSPEKLKAELLAAAEVAGTNAKLSRKIEIESNIGKYESEVAALEEVMRAIKEKKKAKLAAFKLPLGGLEVGETDLMFNGIAFDNLSQAQKISVSMALAIAQNPTLRILKVAEGSFFDDKMLQLVIDFARENNFQVWIERVANKPSGNAIFIEDGEVAE